MPGTVTQTYCAPQKYCSSDTWGQLDQSPWPCHAMPWSFVWLHHGGFLLASRWHSLPGTWEDIWSWRTALGFKEGQKAVLMYPQVSTAVTPLTLAGTLGPMGEVIWLEPPVGVIGLRSSSFLVSRICKVERPKFISASVLAHKVSICHRL